MISVVQWSVARICFVPGREDASVEIFHDVEGNSVYWHRTVLNWNGDRAIGAFEVTVSLWLVVAILVVITWLIIRSDRKPRNVQS